MGKVNRVSGVVEPRSRCLRFAFAPILTQTHPKLGSTPPYPATEFRVSPHRVWVNLGAETGETRLREVNAEYRAKGEKGAKKRSFSFKKREKRD